MLVKKLHSAFSGFYIIWLRHFERTLNVQAGATSGAVNDIMIALEFPRSPAEVNLNPNVDFRAYNG